VPAFYFKMDVIPGHPNQFDLTPTRIGVYDGKCAELCGTYHANMLFKVHVVSVEDYNKHLQQLKAQGDTGEIKPANSVAALTTTESNEGEKKCPAHPLLSGPPLLPLLARSVARPALVPSFGIT